MARDASEKKRPGAFTVTFGGLVVEKVMTGFSEVQGIFDTRHLPGIFVSL